MKNANKKSKITLSKLIREVKEEMTKFKLSEKTMKEYSRDGFKTIINFCTKKNVTEFSETVLNNFIHEKRLAYEEHQIGRMTDQTARKTAELLREFHHTGKLEWGHIPAWNKKSLSPKFEAILENYCKNKYQNLYESTVKTYRSAIKQFLFCIEDMKIYDFKKISGQTVNDAITMLASKYPCGMKNVFSSIRSFLIFLHETGIIEQELHRSLPEYCAPRRAIRNGFSTEEIKALLEAPDRETSIGKRDYAIMLLAVQTGLRAVDIVNLKFENINWHNSEIRIVQHKTGKPLSLPIEPAVGNAIAEYILNGRPKMEQSFVFLSSHPPFNEFKNRSLSSVVDRYMTKCGFDRESVPRRGFHSFRRSFGANLLQVETPLELLSEMFGHSFIDSSKPYLAINETDLRSCALDLSDIEVKAGELKW